MSRHSFGLLSRSLRTVVGQKLATAAALAASVGIGGAFVTSTTGCNTEAYCFENCDSGSSGSGKPSSSSSGSSVGGSGSGGAMPTTGAFIVTVSTGDTMCMPTNGGIEICDGIDNDCNGPIDDIAGIDYNDPKTCGTCSTDCYSKFLNVDPATVKCAASSDPGVKPGTCSGSCADDYYDLDNDGSCEYYCVKSANDDKTCDGKDDNCNGKIDEDVDVCTSTTDCGGCGHNCSVANADTKCVHTGGGSCDTSNTQCAIDKCICTGPGNCFWDIDQSYATGCEYKCDKTLNYEKCGDGIDNDCNGKIDGADDTSQDPQIGLPCWGMGPAPGFTTDKLQAKGDCALDAHKGVTQCLGDQVVCSGANVIFEGSLQEKCDHADNDCDGVIDNNPVDAGGSCGVSNIYPCTLGTFQCQADGTLACIGEKDPVAETCNGKDDNCDGQIDKTNGQDPPDAVGACSIPTFIDPNTNNPKAGTCEALGTCTTPCVAGTKSCTGGTVVCNGAKGATGPADTCGVDANCDGTLTGQPDLNTDVHNCGTCGHDCTAGAVHSQWQCVAKACVYKGCDAGYYDNGGPGDAVAGDQKCGYKCTFIQNQEICNGVDDNCDGKIDEGVVAPSPVQVCGVSPAASTPECTTSVAVKCVSGGWQCTFPAGVCNGSNGCSNTPETCDALDNNCNGQVNENTPNWGKACASDDGNATSDGPCRRTGSYDSCTSGSTAKCSAVKSDCSANPGGCTEVCDGIDNDCDGTIDEPYSAKGGNNTYFYKPQVVQINSNLWISAYEMSRPSAKGSKDAPTPPTAGIGNGYWTSAPAGKTVDKTPACSEPNKLPWFNVTPTEVEQTCSAMGGVICSTTEWQGACKVNRATPTPAVTDNCKWGYGPLGSCSTPFVANSTFCNLGNSYDFDGNSADGIQNGLLETNSSSLKNCYADWSIATGNKKVFDITGNLREIVKDSAGVYKLMGGSFATQTETGAQCDFTFYSVSSTFSFYDTGFRCCYDSDPTK